MGTKIDVFIFKDPQRHAGINIDAKPSCDWRTLLRKSPSPSEKEPRTSHAGEPRWGRRIYTCV